ncbi:hypothetical protein [Mycolicibacterium brumae]|nr:hypothetical protein [Mycolicibacterium brumae]MCV7191370.1 hypothetical protein [Mycolicibacterium brumae]UWW08165.1 hypothetical protein L2Z93_001208 [Mycolicibacterium brumae]
MSREKLGQRMRLRRRELGLTQEAVRASGGPGTTAQRQLEKGRYSHELTPKLTTSIERVLGWEPGSVKCVLDGGEPTLATAHEPSIAEAEVRPDGDATPAGPAVPAAAAPMAAPAPEPTAPALGDQFGLVYEVLAMRESFADTTAGWPEETRIALHDQVERFSRTAENTLLAALSWLPDEARATAYRLLAQLRDPL